ncbi:Deoxyuridine 5'-triphosphate nucleotidohydrolase [Slackia heliotrinireducens]|uniref:Deoxyuridine 5'-triphosphate nucleotidohydrolase n=1 Tax=Slackia heliotrinireducens (strain ATCC 29202 / DSM 20476 / NCTC 11029 / RHS 1) TaxID=471855 RepID=C7N5D3_SLAHD|nr:dUTP diphosphatase [Slackia heliotrinireducens]ACV22118.1 deoxyuridine 5'-triphosphate nucleotidohydrolase [Slackia heliotrinireducens DSM 20476]VEH00138.1 Deoxyuridine 5'-triphosphate nucleotidohydrolase [Slackia heliotrinireducens]
MSQKLRVPIKKLAEDAVVPSYAYDGDAGVDLRATENLVLKPFERALVATSLAVAIPEGYAGLVMPRSGLAIKHGISVVNAPGLIDSHYRGELKVILINLDSKEDFEINVGDRIAQLVIAKVENVDWQPVDELDATDRGAGGFGSSGIE